MSWPKVALGEVMQLAHEAHPVEPGKSYPNLGIYSFGRGVFSKPPIDAATTSAGTLYKVKAGQVIYSRLFAFEGAYTTVPKEFDGAFVSNEFPTFSVRSDRALSAFLGWLFRWPETWRLLRLQSVGLGDRRQRVHPDRLLAHEAPLPPLHDQRRIVARLDAAERALVLAKGAISEIDEDLLTAARNVIWQAGSCTDAWTPCGAFLHQRPLDVRVDAQTAYAFAGVYSFGRGLFRSQAKVGSTFAYPALTRLRTNDFVYPKLMAWEGALGVVPPECDGLVVSPEFPVFEIDSEIVHPAVVDAFFRDPRALPMLRSASSGTNMRRRRIQPSRFLDLKMPIPGPKEQALILDLLDHRRRVLDRHRDSLQALDCLLPALLHEVFR